VFSGSTGYCYSISPLRHHVLPQLEQWPDRFLWSNTESLHLIRPWPHRLLLPLDWQLRLLGFLVIVPLGLAGLLWLSHLNI